LIKNIPIQGLRHSKKYDSTCIKDHFKSCITQKSDFIDKLYLTCAPPDFFFRGKTAI